LDEELSRATRRSQTLSVLRVAMDRHAAYRQELGPEVADGALRTLARLLTEQIRGTDVACRFGEDDFVVLLPGTKPDGAAVLAERLRRAVATVDWPPRQVTVSIGGGAFEPTADDARSLLQRVAAALAEARATGGNWVHIEGLHNPDLLQHTA